MQTAKKYVIIFYTPVYFKRRYFEVKKGVYIMKKLTALVLCAAMLFCGCSSSDNSEEERFSLSKQKQQQYKETIDKITDKFYWNYDDSTLAYYQAPVPSEDTGGIFEASKDSGYNLERYSGKEAVVYTADLYHFNNEKAGLVYFYFMHNSIVGAYYTPDDSNGKSYGLNSRNVFRNNAQFAAFEDREKNEITYSQSKVKTNLYEGFDDIYKNEKDETYFVAIDGNSLKRYRYSGKRFSVANNVNISSLCGYTPVSAAMLKNGQTAVMVGSVVDEAADYEGNAMVIAEKIIYLDSSFKKISYETQLTNGTYTCVGRIGDGFAAINDKYIDIYEPSNGGYEKKESFYLNIQASDFKECDIDGDGKEEYIITDGKDLFIYRKESTGFVCIWRTNISVESFYGNIYTGDTNGDGVKEIYICDNTGTAIKYILTPNGLISDNEKIDYGNRIYAGDFDGNGKDDYLFIDNAEEGTITLNMGE